MLAAVITLAVIEYVYLMSFPDADEPWAFIAAPVTLPWHARHLLAFAAWLWATVPVVQPILTGLCVSPEPAWLNGVEPYNVLPFAS